MVIKTLDKIVTPICYGCNVLPAGGAYLAQKVFGEYDYPTVFGLGGGLFLQALSTSYMTSFITEDPLVHTIAIGGSILASPLTALAKLFTTAYSIDEDEFNDKNLNSKADKRLDSKIDI